MTSQFDALLDFGDDPPPTTNGTAQNANGADDFDPFGSGPKDSGKGGAGDGGLLLDFSVTTEVSATENGTSDPFDSQFTITTSTDDNSASNPFADMSTTDTQPSSNPLYDLMDDDFSGQTADTSSSANPLYDMSTDNTSSDFTFETTVTTTTTTADDTNASANPLYDLMDSEDNVVTMEVTKTETTTTSSSDALLDMDFMSGSPAVEKSTPCEDIVVQANDDYEDQVVPEVAAEQQAGPTEDEPVAESFDQNVELFIREEGEDQVNRDFDVGVEAAVDVGEQQQQQQQQQQQEVEEEVVEVQQEQAEAEKPRSRSRSPPSRHSISSEGEVLNEEEELRQDGRTMYSTKEERTFSETRSDDQPTQFADHGLENGNVSREQREREDIHFQEMSSVRTQFEQGRQEPVKERQQPIDIRQEVSATEGGVYESQPTTFQPQWEEEVEEGVYENEPEQRTDVARESDRNIGAELPSVGTAKNIRDKFVSGQVENRSSGSMKREMTPPTLVDGGVFENQPQYNPDVVHSGEDGQGEILPEQGTARNIASKFKALEQQGSVPVPSPGRREITPDRTGKVEYVSEPRGHVEKYEPQVQAGVFESQPAVREDVVRSEDLPDEILPEKGSAKNMAQRFKQMSTESSSASVPRQKREITPDTSGRVEYVSEPTGYVEQYQGRAESGVFESQPAEQEGVVKSDQLPEEVLPERGTAKNMAARFKEMEKGTKSPPSPSKQYKEFTPPRENGTATQSSGVFESTPQVAPDVVHSDDQTQDVLPERGMAKSLANRFRQLSSGDNTPKTPPAKKEFTPPPNAGVYENTPKQFVPDYNRPAESGILESKPEVRDDVVRGDEPPAYEQELPERGYTRNLVSAWRQRESESAKISPPGSGKPKEFTPPREEPRVVQQRPAPRTPKSPLAGGNMNDGSVHPRDLPGQYQPQAEPSVFESDPDRLDDVAREDDTDWNAGMPKVDTTKKMLAKFRNIQAEAASKESPQRPQPQARKAGEANNSRESTPEQAQNVRY